MKLNQLFPDASPLDITQFMTDSRISLENSLFFCLKGLIHDGHQFIQQAVHNGAVAVVYSEDLSEQLPGIEYLRVSDVLDELNRCADLFFDHPSQKLTVFGVTGTNGKSTIAKTIKELFNQYKPTGYSGTISIEYGQTREKPDYTTPETVPMLQLLNRMIQAGMQAVALEISSQGLDQKRADALRFDIGIFTNLTHDHLDYHGTLENYYLAKKHLFDLMKPEGTAIINLDDPYGVRLYDETVTRKVSFSVEGEADYWAKDIRYAPDLTQFTLVIGGREWPVTTNFVSKFNLSNLLAVIAACQIAGMPLEAVLSHLNALPQVDGRMLVIDEGQAYNVIVDYAHTPDGFEKIFDFAQTITPAEAKIIAVFGAAGKRDTKKRPILGSIADRYCKAIILTEEDPRNESPLEIAQQIAGGIKRANHVIVLDRYDAIRMALDLANAKDTVLVLAKGNEQYMARKYGKEYWIGDERATRENLRALLVEKEKNA